MFEMIATYSIKMAGCEWCQMSALNDITYHSRHKKRPGRSVVRVSFLDGITLNDIARNDSLRRRFGDALHLDL